MRRESLISSAIGLYLICATMNSWAEISGSAHDFSGQGWSGGEICIACHTPHSSDTTTVDAPLWNHQNTTASFTLYSSSSLKVTPTQPRGPSKLCLSCHDGTVAVDSFGGKTGFTPLYGPKDLGIDLSDDHPVSVEWKHQTLETSSSFCLNCHFGAPRELAFYRPGGSGPIWVECATCHDVHNKNTHPKLLRRTLVGSELCLTCHEK